MSPGRDSGDIGVRRWLVAILAAVLLVVPVTPAAADPPGLTWSVSVDGRDIASASPSNPLPLGTADSARVELDLTNAGTSELQVRSIRIEGRVIGMAFFSYTTRLDIVLPAGQQTQRRFDLDISDLTHQATGLLPTSVILIGPDRDVIADKDFATDVRGSVASVYGAFGLVMGGITVVVIAGLLLAILRRQLPRNRWQRGLRFLPSGLGIGLVLTFTLSATRLLVPSALWWLPVLLICGGAAFLIGYLLPIGTDESPQDPAEESAGDRSSPGPPAVTPGADPDQTVIQPGGRTRSR